MHKSISIFLTFISLSFFAQEKHLQNLTQLTFGGDNAEAYFSPNGKFVSFQSNNPKWGLHCDQIFKLDIKDAAKDTTYKPKLISTGKGRTTCSYVMPNGKDILYASTHLESDSCPPVAVIKGKYLWAVYSSFDIFVANSKGKIITQLTNMPGYDAEATISPKGDKIVFTSIRSGDLELWTMDIDGKNQKQITNGLGYDGGAFFSPDGKRIVFRSSRPKTKEEINEYKDLISKGLVAPTNMEIYTCNVDGTDLKQVTKESMFNAFPMFSPDGKKLIFSSNRKNHDTRDTNLWIADWVD